MLQASLIRGAVLPAKAGIQTGRLEHEQDKLPIADYIFCVKYALIRNSKIEGSMQGITATLLARNTSAVLDQVVRERQPILIERGRTVIARLCPVAGTMTAAQALANFNAPALSAREARAWLKDSRLTANESLRDPWE